MQPFTYLRRTLGEAVERRDRSERAAFVAGGSNLVDHLRLGIIAPGPAGRRLGLGLTDIEADADGALRIGAGVPTRTWLRIRPCVATTR